MSVTDVSELRKKREQKRRKNMIIKVFIVLLIIGAVMVAVLTKDMWYSYFDSILTRIPASSGSDRGDTELAEGYFPLTIEGGSGYQIMRMDNCLALLDDSRFHVYNSDGKVVSEKQHSYANPILSVSQNKALIYDLGGQEFSLESKYKTVYSKSSDSVILFARLADNDNAAVVSKSEKFLAMLKIYDSSGECIFTYYSYDMRIINVTFTDSGKGCVLTALYAEGGQLKSRMIRFDFTDKEPKWTSEPVDTLALDVQLTSNGNIIMIGDTKTALFTSEGVLTETYTYKSPLVDFDSTGDVTAIMTSNSEKRSSEVIIMAGENVGSPVVTGTDHSASKLLTVGNRVHVLNDNGLVTYDITGQQIAYADLEDDYDDICMIDKYMYLLGYDSVNRINYST
ncbi:MAG: DUF5711 family protein [Huintestinicola sp.]